MQSCLTPKNLVIFFAVVVCRDAQAFTGRLDSFRDVSNNTTQYIEPPMNPELAAQPMSTVTQTVSPGPADM